LIQILCVSANY